MQKPVLRHAAGSTSTTCSSRSQRGALRVEVRCRHSPPARATCMVLRSPPITCSARSASGGVKLFAISDLHVSHEGNFEVLPAARRPGRLAHPHGRRRRHAGPARGRARRSRPPVRALIWVPGNHELWTLPRSTALRGVARYEALVASPAPPRADARITFRSGRATADCISWPRSSSCTTTRSVPTTFPWRRPSRGRDRTW